jgi:hypothetical protein
MANFGTALVGFTTSEKLNLALAIICLYTVIADVREITESAIAIVSSRARVFFPLAFLTKPVFYIS